MADNIKIVGNIVNTTTVSRYNESDINLIPSRRINENFGGENDYIEFYIYDIAGNLLSTNYNYLSYKLPPSTGLTPGVQTLPNTTGNIQTTDVGIDSTLATPTSSLYPIIEIDPVKDLQDIGYSSGEFKVQYNLFQNKISDYLNKELFIKEISQDRTEIRLASTILSNSILEIDTINLINAINDSTYYVDYLLNFGNNEQYVAVNVALNKASEGYEVLFKLYQPLPLNVQEKQTLWIVEEIVNPYVFDINLDRLITPTPPPTLRGANFDIEIPNQGTISTTYTDYSTSILSLQSLQNSSYHQILNLMNTQSIQINVDYTDFDNFVFFGSAYQRVSNFYTKVKQIEDYNNLISQYAPYVATTASFQVEINRASSSINTLISQFDGYESYLYFESSSYAWPKSGSLKPFSLLSTGSATVINWYNTLTGSAQDYDETNYDNLEYAVPSFIKDDDNNSQYLIFLNMVGQYFDNIWIYLKAITDINLANNNLNKGISKDLVYNQLQSLGIKLYNSQAGDSVANYLVGANTGSSAWDDNFTVTGSYLNNIPRKDLVAEIYKRIYHNLPLLLKTKGTKTGLEYLISTFGIPSKTYITGSTVSSSILNVKEFGGSLKSNLIKGYNNDKVRIVSNTITGSVLSPILSLQTYPTASAQFRENDMHYVDISFSPQTQIDTYISGAIASNDPTWSLDDYIGDPRQQYSTTYPDLDAQRQLYFETGVSGFAPFTGSLLNYNDFIRLIEYFDNALFKMLADFVPERTSLSTGVTINSPVLERNKAVYANPTNSTTESVHTAQYSIASISSSYGTFYDTLAASNNTMGWFDGELEGSTVDVHQYFVDNFNPYLQPTGAIDQNAFAHSDWNVLLNNVSASVLSTKRKKIEYTGNFLPTSSIISSVELQDSYLSLRSYNTSRYEGSRLTSKLYNVYTSGSYTGSNGFTIQTGDKSYGKTAVIDRQSYKVGWVKNIPSQPLNFYDKTQIQLKYLVDSNLDLTDLTLKNNNLVEVQNTFKSGDTVILSLSDVNKPSFQKTLDGTKTIFRGGYSYDPILFRERGENLRFRYIDYFNTIGTTQGIKRFENDWFYYAVNGTEISNQTPRSNYPDTIGSDNIDRQFFGEGYRWTTNYYAQRNFPNGDGGFNIDKPMALFKDNKSTWRYTVSSTSSINFNPSSLSTSNFISSSITSNNDRLIFPFNLFKFNSSSSLQGIPGYNNFDTDVTENSTVLFKAPIQGTYRIKGSIPVSWWSRTKNPGTYFPTLPNLTKTGYSIKFVGILEKCSFNSQRDIDWQYVANTKIEQLTYNSSNVILDSNSSLIGFKGTNNQTYGEESDWSVSFYTSFYNTVPTILPGVTLPNGITVPSVTVPINRPYVDFTLNSGEYLRFRFYIIDLDGFFTWGWNCQFEIGKNSSQTSYVKNIDPIITRQLPDAFIEITNPEIQLPSYDVYTTTTSSSLFSVYDNHIYLQSELYNLIQTSSIFDPTSQTANYYSPVIDNFSIQPQDLIRIGSITDPRPQYYTVLNVAQHATTSTITSSALFVRSDIIWNLIGTSSRDYRSTISVKDTPTNRSFFEAVKNSPSRQFTVSGLTRNNLPNNITYTIVDNAHFKYYNSYIYMGVSNDLLSGNLPTVPVNAGGTSVIYTLPTAEVQGYGWGVGVTASFTSVSPINVYTSSLDITVDRSIATGSIGNLSTNFAILRPKPDETSVIINFRKSLGDVSQTILIPQDANDTIKNNVGNIFQQLNVDLSNQNINTQ